MSAELIAYPFLFAAVYFQAFLLVTLLSAPARAARTRAISEKTPSVAIIVPCYNEETTIAGTAASLLALDYPKELLRVILVDDGSTDGTAAAMLAFEGNPQVTIITQKNGGKHTALNAGIAAAGEVDIVGCLDADSFVEASALREMIACFDDPKVGAATAAMSVHNPSNLLEAMQNAEYVMGIALRHILAAVNGIYVTPGPFSLYNRELVVSLGGFRKGHNTEDMEMALRLQRAGFVIDSAPKARVFTKTPSSVGALVKQRIRWTTGFLRNMMYDYRDLVGNPKYGALGLIVLPLSFLAIGGGILMFVLFLYQTGHEIVDGILRASGVPLEFTVSTIVPHGFNFEWFYIPVSFFALLAAIALIGSIALIVIGKRISGTPSKLGAGIVGWVFLYGLIAPFWLIGSVADVVLGTVRTWR